jgi:hypothetical protein
MKIFRFGQTKLRTKITLAAILFLMLTVSSMTAVPYLNAQTASSPIPTYAYLVASPNPVGFGQQVTLVMWLVPTNPAAGGSGESTLWTNFTLLITKPDNTTQTLGPFTADTASSAYATYTPEATGTYTVEFRFPGQHAQGVSMIGQPIDSYYGPSSFTTTITVQQEPVLSTAQNPLPTEYWKRPINAQNHEWYTISGNWFGTGQGTWGTNTYNASGNFNPYTTAPKTAHIVWTKPLGFGGLIGGEFGGTVASNYYNGKTYEAAFTPPVIINGVLYYNDPDPPKQGFTAVDLRTGETLWHQNTTSGITNGQVLNFISPNQAGGIPYLWSMTGDTWYMYNAVTGNLILQIANATSAFSSAPSGSAGSVVEGSNGELLYYNLDANHNWLALWNSTLCILASSSAGNAHWRPQTGATLDWQAGIQWNVTTNSYPGQRIDRIDSGVLLATTGNHFVQAASQMEIGYSMTTGEELWVQNRTLFEGATNYGLIGAAANGIYTEFYATTMQWYGYSITTGEKVWGPSKAYTNAWGSIADNDVAAQSAYGILYAQSVDGIHALNITTGELLFDFYADSSGVDFPGFSTYPFECNMLYTIADEKVIASTGNSHGNPLYRGTRLYVFDALTGEPVWSINGYYQQSLPIADGYLIGFNLYDNQLYCFGKSNTATTVTTASVYNNPAKVLITGTVTDQSPGETCLGIPAAGTPAISDDSMSQWMEYLYMQQQKPTNATGVPVTLSVIDSNGNYREIGSTTTDSTGQYSFTFTPDIPGTYKIIATFAGTDSYYSSTAQTIMNFDMPSPSATPPSVPQSVADTYFVPAVAGLFALIIVVLVVLLLLMLRKRP